MRLLRWVGDRVEWPVSYVWSCQMCSAAYNRHHGPHEAFSHIRHLKALRPMDIEWLTMLSNGYHVKELATASNVSEQIVKNRLQSVRQFMRVETTTHAVAEAIRQGIIK